MSLHAISPSRMVIQRAINIHHVNRGGLVSKATLAVHAAKHHWQIYAVAPQDLDVQYVHLICAQGFVLISGLAHSYEAHKCVHVYELVKLVTKNKCIHTLAIFGSR